MTTMIIIMMITMTTMIIIIIQDFIEPVEYSRSLLDQPHWGLPRRLSWDFYDADDDDDDSGSDSGDDDGDGDGDDYDVGPSSLRFASSFILRHFLLMIMIKAIMMKICHFLTMRRTLTWTQFRWTVLPVLIKIMRYLVVKMIMIVIKNHHHKKPP